MDIKQYIPRFGIISKGAIYILSAGLAVLYLIGFGGGLTDTHESLDIIYESKYGLPIVLLLGLGLICYGLWRVYQAITDEKSSGSNLKGYIVRGGYFLSGLFYGTIGIAALENILDFIKDDVNTDSIFMEMMQLPYGNYLVIAIGLGLLGKAIFQFISIYNGDFRAKIADLELSPLKRKIITIIGRVGFISRGIVFGIMGYSITLAGITRKWWEAGGQKDVFLFIIEMFGEWALLTVAIGMVLFGIFELVKAKFRLIKIS